MRRDMDLIREILKAVAESAGPVGMDALEGGHRSHDLVGYHFQLLKESGLAVVSIRAAGGDPYYSARVERLTWAGCDYLDAIASDTIWQRVKRELLDLGGVATADVVKMVASRLVMQQLGLS